jgi:Flp pilus assembly protein TadG
MSTIFCGVGRGAAKVRAASPLRADRGAVTVVFALLGGVMIACLAMAVDLIDDAMTEARMQAALDAATLSSGANLAHFNCANAGDLAQWQQDARAYFDANMSNGPHGITIPAATFAATCTGTPALGETIRLSAKGTLPILAPVMLGTGARNILSSDFDIGAQNAAMYQPKSTLELVLVLDNTGSMADAINGVTKMDGLKAAAHALVDDVLSASNADAYVGIVPFTTTVNVKGALPPGGSWLSPVFSYNPTNVGMQPSANQDGWGGCTVEPRDANRYLYPQPYGPNAALKFTPYYYNVPPGGLRVRTYSGRLCGSLVGTSSIASVPFTLTGGLVNVCGFGASQGEGIATVFDQIAGSTAGTQTVRQNADCIANPVTFLTTDTGTLSAAIDRMSPDGSTIIPEGVLWGWRMLSSDWSNAAAPGSGWISSNASLPLPETTPGLRRVMIVLTDGENQVGGRYSIPNDLYFNGLSGVGTNSLAAPSVFRSDGTSLANGTMDFSEYKPLPSDGQGYSDDVNTFQLAACSAIKASGITLYAITFGSVSKTAASTMQRCATAGDYYHAPNSATLNTIFQQIAGSLGTLRLTQ